jgi:hypothetical protein
MRNVTEIAHRVIALTGRSAQENSHIVLNTAHKHNIQNLNAGWYSNADADEIERLITEQTGWITPSR